MSGDSSDAPFVSSRQFGEARVTVIGDGIVTVPAATVCPPAEAEWLRAHGEADAAGLWVTGQAVIHVRLGATSIVVDPAFDDPGTAWDRRFAAHWPRVVRTPGLHAGLAQIGVRPEEVTHVLITHAHDDHFAGVAVERDGQLVPRFPNARHLIGRADWEGNPRRGDAEGDLEARLGLIDRLGLLDLVEGDREVAPGVALIHAPGETPGHSIVRVGSGGAWFYAIGDLVHHGSEIAHPDWHSPWVEPAAMRASRDRFFAEAVPRDATVVFTHEAFPAWGQIVTDGDGYRWARDA